MKLIELISNGITIFKEELKSPLVTKNSDSQQNQNILTAENKPSSLNNWWRRKNAEYYRDQCSVYTRLIFPQPIDLEVCFGDILSKFWAAHGNWRIISDFPEIHVTFVAADVFSLRDPWNRRDLNLKKAISVELLRAYTDFARAKLICLGIIHPVHIADIWLLNDALIMEIPNSEFSVNYPELARILVPENYWELRNVLSQRSSI